MVNFSLEGKKAIVTGGSRGLGRGIAQGLHDAGAELVLIGVQDHVKDTASEIGREGAPVHYCQGDLADTDKLETFVDTCEQKLGGRIDILVNCAGIQHRCPAEDFPQDIWRKIIDVNLSSVFFMSQTVGRRMIRQGYGKIINVASMTSFFGSVLIPAYASSKGGIAQLTKALSNEWSGKGVNVNAIAPGYMATALTDDMKRINPAQYEEITGRIPMGRWGTAEDLEGIAVFLASDASAYISGAVIPVDGGFLGK